MSISKYLAAVLILAFSVSMASAQSRATLNTYNNQNITTNGRGAITGALLNNLESQIINGVDLLNDNNTNSGLNSYIGNVPGSMTADGARLTVQNSSLTAAGIYQVFNPLNIYDGVRSVMQCAPPSQLLGCSGIGSYVYNINPRTYNSNGSVLNQNNGVGVFVEVIGGANGVYNWIFNSADNDSDLLGGNHAIYNLGFELDTTVRNALTIANPFSIIANFIAQPASSVAISVGQIATTIPSTGFGTGINLGTGSIEGPCAASTTGPQGGCTANGTGGGTGFIIGGEYGGDGARAVGLLATGSDSNDQVYGFSTSLLAASNTDAITIAPMGNGGSGCASGTFPVSGGTLGIYYTTPILSSAIPATLALVATGGVITSASVVTASAYSVFPGTETVTSPHSGIYDNVAVSGTSCSTTPLVNITAVPAGDSIEKWASSSATPYGGFYSRDLITGGTIAASYGGNISGYVGGYISLTASNSNANIPSIGFVFSAKTTTGNPASPGFIGLTPYMKLTTSYVSTGSTGLAACSAANLGLVGLVTDSNSATSGTTYTGGSNIVALVLCTGVSTLWKVL